MESDNPIIEGEIVEESAQGSQHPVPQEGSEDTSREQVPAVQEVAESPEDVAKNSRADLRNQLLVSGFPPYLLDEVMRQVSDADAVQQIEVFVDNDPNGEPVVRVKISD